MQHTVSVAQNPVNNKVYTITFGDFTIIEYTDVQTVTIVTTLKPKAPTSLNIVLPTTLVLVGLSMVLIGGFYLYLKHKRRGRTYQVNDAAPWQNRPIEIGEDDTGNSQLRTAGERPREVRQISTASIDTSGRSSLTSLKWNMAYFLYKIFGSTETSPTVVPPSRTSSTATVDPDYELEKVDDDFMYNSYDEGSNDPDYVNVKAAV